MSIRIQRLLSLSSVPESVKNLLKGGQMDLSIPEISNTEIKKLSHIRPVIRKGRALFYLQQCDPRNTAFTWAKPESKAKGLKEKARIRTLHSYGYYGFFKPSVAEVLAQIPKEQLKDVVAFETNGPDTADDLNKHKEELNAGFHVAETILYTKSNDSSNDEPFSDIAFNAADVEERLDHTAFLVQATNEEHHMLWHKFFDYPDKRYYDKALVNTWEQGSGSTVRVGFFGEHGVHITIMWDLIDGQWIGFWEASSRVVDYQMIEQWFDMNFDRKTSDNRRAMTNATNFHIALEEIQALNKKKNG